MSDVQRIIVHVRGNGRRLRRTHGRRQIRARGERKHHTAPVWPRILRGDAAAKICAACEHLRTCSRNGRPKCDQVRESCSDAPRFPLIVLQRRCPLGRHVGIDPHPLSPRGKEADS